MVELVPCVDELFLIYEFGLDQMNEWKDSFEIHFLFVYRVALV